MYGKLDESILDNHENFQARFAGTDLEEVATRLDAIVELYQDKDIDKDTAAELIQDIKNEQETAEMASSMQIRSDLLKAADFLMKIL